MAKSKLDIFIGATNKASGPIGKVSSSLGNLGKIAGGIALGGLTATATGAVALGTALVKMAIDAAPLENIEKSFKSMAEASGQSSSQLLKDLQEQSAGMITNADLMTSYNKATQLVSAQFANQLPEAMGYLGKVAAATGQDMNYMLDSLVTGVGRGSKMILDNLGITVDLEQANKDYAESLGITTSELTDAQKQTALMNQVMEKLAENTKDMPDLMGTSAQKIEAFKTSLKNTKDEIGLALLPALTPLLDTFGELAAKILPKVVDFITVHVVPAVQALAQLFSGLISGDIKIGDLIPPEFLETIRPIIDAFKNLIAVISEDFPLMKEKGQEFIDFVKTQLGGNLPLIVNNIASMINTLSGIWQEHGETIINVVTTVAKILVAGFVGAFTLLTSITSGAWKMLEGIMLAVSMAIEGNWEGAWIAIKTTAQFAWESIKRGFHAFVSGILEATGMSLNTFLQIWKSNFEMLKIIIDDKIQGIADKINDFLVGIVQKVVTWVTDIKTSFTEAVDNIKAAFDIDWGELGKSIIEGIGTGIMNAASSLAQSAADAAKSALDAAKNALGIQSPSKAFMVVGEQMMKGMALGITDKMGLAQAATVNASVGTIPNLAGGYSSGGSNITIVYSPQLSLASRGEFEDNLMPLLTRAMSRYHRENGLISVR